MLKLRKRIKKPDLIEEMDGKRQLLPVADRQKGLDFLVTFFSRIRPGKRKNTHNSANNLNREFSYLHEDSLLLQNLQHALLSQLINTDLTSALTESGIPLARGFWQEFSNRLKHKLLPPLQNERDFLYVINRVFFNKEDYKWVESIPRETWIDFFDRIGLSFEVKDVNVQKQLLRSLKILSFQIAQLGLEKEVVNYIMREQQRQNPFVQQNYLVHDLEQLLEIGAMSHDISSQSVTIQAVVSQCYNCIEYIRTRHSERGASLNQTYLLLLLSHRLERLLILLDILDTDHHVDVGRLADLFLALVRNENRRNSIREFLSQGIGYLAYQIAEHKGKKGNKYITSTKKEYWSMVRSAMKGGGVVSVLAIIKNLLTNIVMAPFWHGFAYSVNYGAGFVYIEQTNSTLATKQPAFTASVLASSLDTRKTRRPDLQNLAVTVAKVSRSQVASFFGNLIIVFPAAFGLAWLYHFTFGAKLVEGEAAAALLRDQHPWQSPSLFYACIAGFFLFLSGIIAGYIQNKIQYSRIADRLQMHPVLRLSFSTERLQKLAVYIEKNAGTIIGNVALGFFLGMAGIIGHLFGLYFDVRHITLSAGNTAIAVYGLGFTHIRPLYLLTIILGVLGIGFLNFLVSFFLAFSVAVKSRGVRLSNYPEFLKILWKYFKKKPLDFIRAPKEELKEE